ncbi:hypothetical protein P7K49_031545 [Saguinus oedipus]|uniref:Uncharacterized protein n=1 Tax=Saguinus oedipus TaxID=9490 RepID=A0ABQ9TZQ6_SAGOE|nr:hypothetical protein P7K49_031545 [Saguinus oedipus]
MDRDMSSSATKPWEGSHVLFVAVKFQPPVPALMALPLVPKILPDLPKSTHGPEKWNIQPLEPKLGCQGPYPFVHPVFPLLRASTPDHRELFLTVAQLSF